MDTAPPEIGSPGVCLRISRTLNTFNAHVGGHSGPNRSMVRRQRRGCRRSGRRHRGQRSQPEDAGGTVPRQVQPMSEWFARQVQGHVHEDRPQPHCTVRVFVSSSVRVLGTLRREGSAPGLFRTSNTGIRRRAGPVMCVPLPSQVRTTAHGVAMSAAPQVQWARWAQTVVASPWRAPSKLTRGTRASLSSSADPRPRERR